jgi:hypothetical protein
LAAERAGYAIELHDAFTGGAGTFDAILVRTPALSPQQARLAAPPTRRERRGGKPWSHYTNSPWLGVFLRTVVPSVRQHLCERVPEHLIPSHFVPLTQMPRTPAGKVDRDALPAPERARPDLSVEYLAATSQAEKTLAAIWAEALRVDDVGIYDNYFELGGDSILGIQIVARARAAGFKMTPRDLFTHQTIAELVRSCVSEAQEIGSPASIGADAENGDAGRFALSGLSPGEIEALASSLEAKRRRNGP